MHHDNNNEIISRIPHNVLRKRIMRRVYAVWLIKKILSPITAKIVLFAALAKQLFMFVSVRDVIINSPPAYDVFGSTQFFTSAFLNTSVMVQVSLVGIAALALWLSRDFTRRPIIGSHNAMSFSP
ncbi:hypothetical protein L0Y69_00970 [bacterium]|nr:hypothetical protein [bacterium]